MEDKNFIVIVEDQEEILDLLKQMFQLIIEDFQLQTPIVHPGYKIENFKSAVSIAEIKTYKNPYDAIEFITKNFSQICLIITDEDLKSDIKGGEMLSGIINKKEFYYYPLTIIHTASGDNVLQHYLELVGKVFTLHKPVSMNIFKKMLLDLFEMVAVFSKEVNKKQQNEEEEESCDENTFKRETVCV